MISATTLSRWSRQPDNRGENQFWAIRQYASNSDDDSIERARSLCDCPQPADPLMQRECLVILAELRNI
jgi:hypothetical protein